MKNLTKHLIIDGSIYSEADAVFTSKNRSFRYGDSLFETMRAYQDQVFFFGEHFTRITESALQLKMQIPASFDKTKLHCEIIALLKKNRLYKGARVRLSLYRKDGGNYIPEINNCSYMIEVSELESIKYGHQERGLSTGVFPDMKKPSNFLSHIKSANALLYVISGIYAKENNWDECIILNEKNKICEATSSNIFIVKGTTILTPPVTDYPLQGIMRKKIIELSQENYTVFESSLTVADLLDADEIFLTNAVVGIKWVLCFLNRRYYHNVSAELLIKLNKEVNLDRY